MEAAERLLNRAYGRPALSAEVISETSLHKEIVVRWLPVDPNDASKVIEPI